MASEHRKISRRKKGGKREQTLRDGNGEDEIFPFR